MTASQCFRALDFVAPLGATKPFVHSRLGSRLWLGYSGVGARGRGPNCARSVPEWCQERPRMVPGALPNGARNVPEWQLYNAFARWILLRR